jgi:hypothetical protein
MAVTINNAAFCDVTLYGFDENRRFGVSYRHHHQDEKNQQTRSNVIPSSLITSIAMMETLSSSETSVLITAIRRQIPEGGILHSMS